MSAAVVLVALWIVLGGLWRRAMGGWLAISRSAIVWAGIAVLSLPVGLLVGKLLWWPYGLLAYAFHFGVSFLFFVCGLHLVDWLDDLISRFDIRGDGNFIDGHRSVCELVSGAVWYLPAALCWLWVL